MKNSAILNLSLVPDPIDVTYVPDSWCSLLALTFSDGRTADVTGESSIATSDVSVSR